MSEQHSGGCLCGAVRFTTSGAPQRVTYCHCRFCQKVTGAAYVVDPVFLHEQFAVTAGTPATFAHVSEGSGKALTLHFCATCSTRLFLTFERFAEFVGVYGGTYDDPNWFDPAAPGVKHIHLATGRRGTVIPAGIPAYEEYIVDNNGTPCAAKVFETPHVLGADD